MKTPRDLSGAELAKVLRRLGYAVTRQAGSHLRVTTHEGGEHHEVIGKAGNRHCREASCGKPQRVSESGTKLAIKRGMKEPLLRLGTQD